MSKYHVFFMPHPPIIIPEIGIGDEMEAKTTIEAMKKLGEIAGELRPDTIIFITPHGNSFHNGTCILDAPSLEGDFSIFGHPEVAFKKRVNQGLSRRIGHALEQEDYIVVLLDEELSKAYGAELRLDNGVMVPMYFIDRNHQEYDIVHITPGATSFKENFLLGREIQRIVGGENDKVLMVCSGDLSH